MRELESLNAEAAPARAAYAWLPRRGGRPTTRRVAIASCLGGSLGALAAATMFPALPALMFGAAIAAYSGFLATAMEALESGELPER